MTVLKQLYSAFLCACLVASPALSSSDEEEASSDEVNQKAQAIADDFSTALKALSLGETLVFESGGIIALAEEVPTQSEDEIKLRKQMDSGDTQAMFLLAKDLQKRYAQTKSIMDRMEALNLYLSSAKAGFVPSMLALSECYVDGDICEKSPKSAMKWARQAYSKGDRDIDSLQLVRFLIDGIGCPGDDIDKEEALEITKEMALRGSLSAIEQYAIMLDGGIGCAGNEADQNEATTWYRIGVEKGSKNCMYALATRLIIGKGCEISEETMKEALEILECLSKNGSKRAKSIVGYMKLHGEGCAPESENTKEGLAILEELIAEGDQYSKLILAQHLLRDWAPNKYRADYIRAFELLKEAAEADLPEAMYAYGYCLQEGIGCISRLNEKIEAHIQYSNASLHGFTTASDNLIYCMIFGIGCDGNDQNRASAAHLLNTSDFPDMPFTNYCLGYLYAIGGGVAVDTKKAMGYLKPYEFEDGICPLILYMHLKQKDYQGALTFYEKAQKEEANLAEDPRLVDYLKFMIRHKNPVGVKKGNRKTRKGGQNEYEFSDASLKQDVGDLVRQYKDLRNYLVLKDSIHNNLVATRTRGGSLFNTPQNKTNSGNDVLKRMSQDLVRFNKSFRAAEDNTFRRIEINAYISNFSAVQEEVFLVGLEKEFSTIQEHIASLLRFTFVHGGLWVRPYKGLSSKD